MPTPPWGVREHLGMHTHASAPLQPGKASVAYIVAGATSPGVAVWVPHCVGDTMHAGTGCAERAWCIMGEIFVFWSFFILFLQMTS